MRVLWFTLTPSLATEKLTGTFGVGCGWMESMEKKLMDRDNIELAVSFPWKVDKVDPFELDGTKYYPFPLYPQGNKLTRYVARLTASLEPAKEVDHFMEVINDFKPDIIHIFGSEKAYGLVIPKVDVPVVIWIQGNLTVYTHKWFAGVSKRETFRLTPFKSFLKATTQFNLYRRGLNAAKREKEIFANCRHFIGRTDWDRRITSILSPEANYHYVSEIMREEFYQVDWKPHRTRDRLVIMTTSQRNLYKGWETLFASMIHLNKIMPGKVEWRIAGLSGDDEVIRMMEKKFKVSHSKIGIQPLGRVSAQTLVDELMYADMFVHPSHIDNSPNSVCEAMVVGTPVVATYAGGTDSLLENRHEGLLVQPGDPWSLAGAILDMYRNPDNAVEMSDNAKRRARLRHDPDKIVSDLLNVYDKMRKKELVHEQ